MSWNWNHFFEDIGDLESFSKSIDDKTNYSEEVVQSVFLDSKDLPTDLVYSPWSYNFFELSHKRQKISIDKKFLLRFLNDYKNKLAFNSRNHTSKYISYESLLNIYLSRDMSSGSTIYKSRLKSLLDTVIEFGASIEGKELISSREDLEAYLKKELRGFNSLDEELA